MIAPCLSAFKNLGDAEIHGHNLGIAVSGIHQNARMTAGAIQRQYIPIQNIDGRDLE